MEIKSKDIDLHTFEGPTDSDTGTELFPRNRVRRMLNARRTTLGDKGLITNILGNLLIRAGYVTGNNKCLGYKTDEQYGKLYYFNYNDAGYHGIYVFDAITQAVTPVLQNLIDTNNVDILKFVATQGINHVDIVYVINQVTNQVNTLIYWIDAYNKGRKTNVQKCIDKTSTGYGTVITEDFITAYKQCSVFAPTSVYFTDTTRTSNYLYGQQFKFAVRFYYDDNEISNWSDWSGVPIAPNEDFQGAGALTFSNNGIQVTIMTGSKLVVKLEIGMLSTAISPNIPGEPLITVPWKSVVTLVKSVLNIPDYGYYTFNFYNDGSYGDLDQAKILRQFSFMPRTPKAQSLVKVALTYGNFFEGFPSVPVNISIDLNFTPFYLPSDTTSALNDPSIAITLTSIVGHGGIFNSWQTTVTHFIVGEDVKKGNIFVINSFGGNGARSISIPAALADDATTIASAIKQFLRSLDAVGTGVVSNESTDGSGNVSWDFTIEAHEGKNAITFSGSVNPVNVITLLDNGLSLNTKKMGSTEKYAVVYEDDDGRTGLANTSDACLVNIPFETEILPGQTNPIGLQQPVVTLSIMHLPPSWAKCYRLVRTSGPSTFIQMLIQQVNIVVVANENTYLDLIVGSLFTYQKIHPDTILAYQFSRGDRLRLIADESGMPDSAAVPYVPFFETEILGYTIDEEQFRDASITCVGTNIVTPADGVQADFIGKYIIIDDNQRLITAISGSTYILDEAINPNPNYISNPTATLVYPNYTIKDTRGIIRINLPPAAITVNPMAKVEIMRPQQNVDNQDYQNFFDFQQKFEILNWGTPMASHVGNLQNQDPANPVTTPAVIQVTNGDAWVRNRAMPSNNQDPNPQVIIDKVCDPNFSDFYVSNLYNTGKVYPQDQGNGQVNFTQRFRFSNNYIENTQVNGLNDFDELDYIDYNDPHGEIILSRYKNAVLYIFKQLKTLWTHVYGKIITDNSGNDLLTTTDKLLNEAIPSVWEGGIGNNPEGFVEDGDFMWIPSANSGVFLRIGQDGSIPISELYFYDKEAKELLTQAATYGLSIPGGFDKPNGEVIWTIPDFIQYIFNNKFNAGDWASVLAAWPDGTTWAITQQPANSVATIVGSQIEITGTNTLGNDYLKFQGTLPDSSLTPVINFCFTVVVAPNRATAWRVQSGSIYCLQADSENNGQEGWKILEQYYTDNNALTGLIMPNVPNISPEAIVPSTATITYNQETNVSPTGGTNGDVWYNGPANQLYIKAFSVWTPLYDTAINTNYAPSITNLTDCPLPTPPPETCGITPSVTSVDTGLGIIHSVFTLDNVVADDVDFVLSVDYTQNGITYHGIIDESLDIPTGNTVTSDIEIDFDPGAGTVTLVTFIWSVSPNPIGDGTEITYSSPTSISV